MSFVLELICKCACVLLKIDFLFASCDEILICDEFRYHDGASPLPNMSDLLALLHTNSPLSLIHRYLDVPSIDSEEILEKLKKTAVDINDENEDQKKGATYCLIRNF